MFRNQAPMARLALPAVLLICSAAFAQWSDDPATNLAIGDRSGEQAQPKIRATSDGGCYISWFDNSAGGYDVYLQRLDASGTEQWPHNGLLIADRGFSSTQDYGLTVDGDDHAVLAYRDDRTGSVQISAQLVDPAGTKLWGASGVQASVTSGGNLPRVAATSDGNYIVGWTIGAGFRLQKLSAAGAAQWGADGILESPATGSYTLSELVGSDAGTVIALWVRPIGNFMSDKHLYTQKYAPSGTQLWDRDPGTPAVMDPVIVYDGGSVQIGYFPTFVSDGAGGAVFGWYETSGNRDAYVQRVAASGAELFAHNGVSAATTANRLQLTPSVAFDAASGDIYLAWPESNSGQSQWGLYAQRFASGARQWGAGGVELLPLSGQQPFFVNALSSGGDLILAALSNPTGTVLAARLDPSGAALWTPSPLPASSLTLSRSRLNAALSSNGVALLAWSDARHDVNDVFAQNINPDGSLGAAPCPADLDGSGQVDLTDLSIQLANFGLTGGAGPEDGDLDGDQDVDLTDLSLLLAAFGTLCL